MPRKTQPKRPIIAKSYARVSSEEQRDNTSITDQHRRNRDHIAAKGWTCGGEYQDIIGGTLINARLHGDTGYKRILDEAKADIATQHIIVVTKRDRLGRGDAAAVLEHAASQAGVIVEYVEGEYDLTTSEGVTRRAMTDLISGVERIQIRDRMYGGKQSVLRSGKHLGIGRAPYGYDQIKQYDTATGRRLSISFQPNTHAATVLRICDMIEAGHSMRGICAQFEAEGIPSPTGGKRWHVGAVRDLINNTAYSGQKQYNRVRTRVVDGAQGRRVERHKRPPSEVINVPIPPLITKERQEKLIEIVSHNGGGEFRKGIIPKLCNGFLYCASCGSRMIGISSLSPTGKRNEYYRCSSKFYTYGDDYCRVKFIKRSMIDVLMWDMVLMMLTTDASVNHLAEVTKPNYDELIAQNTKLIARIERDIAGKLEAVTRLELRMAETSDITKRGVMQSTQDTLYAQISKAQTEQAKYVAENDKHTRAKHQVQDVGALRDKIKADLKTDLTVYEKREVLKMIEWRASYDSANQCVRVSSLLGTCMFFLLR